MSVAIQEATVSRSLTIESHCASLWRWLTTASAELRKMTLVLLPVSNCKACCSHSSIISFASCCLLNAMMAPHAHV
jgi:hypothetical protein